MFENKKILWISSYPKSGNTWLRLILCGLFFTEDGTLNDFNLLKRIPRFDTLRYFKFIKNISTKDYNKIFNSTEFNDQSIVTYSKYWIEAQKRIKINKGNFAFFKTHNARVKINNCYYTDPSTTLGYIYISRDPRDIVISYSKFSSIDFNTAIDLITTGQVTTKEKIDNRMPEITLNWRDHYLSWKKFSAVPSLFLKYEDLLHDIEFEIKKITDFFYNNYNIKVENQSNKIKNIIESTKFYNLKKIESESSFIENPGSSFFREGKRNQWINILNKEQIDLLELKFRNQLIELNYIIND